MTVINTLVLTALSWLVTLICRRVFQFIAPVVARLMKWGWAYLARLFKRLLRDLMIFSKKGDEKTKEEQPADENGVAPANNMQPLNTPAGSSDWWALNV